MYKRNDNSGIFLSINFFYSGNGTFLGVGTAEGDISVFIAWNLVVSNCHDFYTAVCNNKFNRSDNHHLYLYSKQAKFK